jgi:hypothetical protein
VERKRISRNEKISNRKDILDRLTICNELDDCKFETIEIEKRLISASGSYVTVAFLFFRRSRKTKVLYSDQRLALVRYKVTDGRIEFKNRMDFSGHNSVRNLLRILARWYPRVGVLDAGYEEAAKLITMLDA